MLTRVPLRAVLFDWDGTLLNSYAADSAAFLQMFHALGVPWGLAELNRHYSPDWYHIYRAAELPQEKWAEADRLWRKFYSEERPILHQDARRVIHNLGLRYQLGLVTSGSADRVRTQLQFLGLEKAFAVRVFGGQLPRRKPHPAQLEVALRRLRVPPVACVYVGDTPEDIYMARRAGVASIGIVGQSPVPERLRAARPNALIRNLSALPSLLRDRHNGK